MKCKLKDLGTVSTGNTPNKSNEAFYDSEDIGFVKPDTLSDCKVTERIIATEYISENARSKARIVGEGAVFVTCIGSIGKIGLADGEFAFNQQINAIQPNNKVLSKYLAYCMLYNKKSLQAIANAPVVPIINKSQFEDFEIEIEEDIEEQKKVVEIFDKLNSVIISREAELQELDNLIKSRFVELFGNPEENPFGWDKMPLSNVIINANNGMARRGNDEDGNIVMRLVELQDGYIDYSNPNRISLNDNEKKRYLLKDKDFLFARVNGNPDNVGRCAVFHDIGEEVYHNDHIIRVHFNEELLDGIFASALLNSDYGKRQLKSQIKTSAGQYTVSQDGIGAIVAILPSMKLQKEFADFVRQVTKLKFEVQKSLDETQTLMDSLMQQYFG